MSRRLIGVDVGGTKIAVAVLDGATLQSPLVEPTDCSSGAKLVDQLVRAVRAVGEARAVGVAVPSVVDFATGRVRSSVNVPLQDVALREVLRERLGVPVYVDNDATCAALAEAYDDDGALAARHLVMFTVGTGVGGGIVIDGRIYRGATGAAAELGHTIVAADLLHAPFRHGERFPQPGSLESLASGSALNELGRRLGVGIANAINTFDPDVVVVGGGGAIAGELLLAPAREEARRFTLTGVGTRTEIRLARYGSLAGVRGAALLAGHEVEHERAQLAAPVRVQSS